MRTRAAGVVATSVLACLLAPAALATVTVAASYADSDVRRAALRDDETCFGVTPDRELSPTTDFVGGDGPDVIFGGNVVDGGGGDDLICDAARAIGGAGDDRIRVIGSATARGGAGDDEIVAIAITTVGESGATLVGGPGNDVFWGSTLGETIKGGPGHDVVWAGGGNDHVVLGKGNDRGNGQTGDDRILGGADDDVIDGGPDRDEARAGAGYDRCISTEIASDCES